MDFPILCGTVLSVAYPEYSRHLLVDDAVVLHDDAPPLRAARRDRRPEEREDVEVGGNHLKTKR